MRRAWKVWVRHGGGRGGRYREGERVTRRGKGEAGRQADRLKRGNGGSRKGKGKWRGEREESEKDKK